MKNQFKIIIFTIIFVIILYLYLFPPLVWVKSCVDNNYYLVKNKHNKQKASNILAKTNYKINKIFNELEKKYINDSNYYFIKNFKLRYSHKNLIENINLNSTAYSINKNKIFICLRNKNSFVDENTILYVTLHEITHLVSNNFVNTPEEHYTDKEFNFIFKTLLKTAKKLKYFNEINKPTPYCAITIYKSWTI